jgi:hypothetical protein
MPHAAILVADGCVILLASAIVVFRTVALLA